MATVQAQRKPPAKLRRRTFLAAATVGVCGAGALAAPHVAPYVEDRMHQAALDVAAGELRDLEGVSLDAAIRAAEITHAAVQVVVLPVARLASALGSGGLGLVLRSLDIAHAALALAHAPTGPLDNLRAVVASWQQGTAALPIALAAYTSADITSAEVYLKSLKRQMARSNGGGNQ